MSDNQSARHDDSDVEMDQRDDDVDESVIADRQPRAPSITRLGRYRLVREIASGGMATVNLAVADGLDKLVALKIIHPHLAQEDSFVRMFLDEARLASAISHRNVCNVFDFGETDGRFYIAMDFLSGQSLRDVLRRMRKTDLQMEPRRVAVYIAYLMAEACEGLHAAHELHGVDGQLLNVVHRDVSPHNLFVTYDGNVSVVDFGIARASDRIQSTATGVLKGKFSYMAPEQMRQLDVDRRADIWALGVVLWESLVLQRLFVRSSQADTVMSVMMDRVRPPSELKPDLPKELDTIVLRAISRNPAHRYPTAREMGRELMKFCRESGVMVSPIEIEHFMERLFAQEIADNKALLRKAKQSGGESGVWMEVTPSGFSRVARRSGMVERVQTEGSLSVDVVGDGTTASAARMHSQLAHTAEALPTAHPRSRLKRFAWLGALAACAALGGTWYVQRRPVTVPLAEAARESSNKSDPKALEANEPPANIPSVTPLTPEDPKREPAPAHVARTGAVAAPRPELLRRPDPRLQRPVAKPAAPQQPVAHEPAQPEHVPPRNAPQDELAMRGAEPVSAVPASAEANEEASVPAPQPAPPPVAVVSKPAASVPALPQKLEAQVSFVELDVEGSLGSSIVVRMLSRSSSALKSCYAQAAKRAGRNDFAGLPVSLVIDESGSIRQLTVAKHPLSELSGCASDALKRLRSERVPDVGTAQVRFKIALSP